MTWQQIRKQIAQRSASARECGALEPIETELSWLDAGELRFAVRWVSSLERKARSARRGAGKKAPDKPFQPWDKRLEVCKAGADHVALLNKFPVIEDHLLIITRQFEDQRSPLSAADFSAVAPLLAAAGGVCFYNGGAAAGASQRHRHLQWIADDGDGTLPLLPVLERAAKGDRTATIPFEHALTSIADIALAGDTAGPALADHYRALCRRTGLDPSTPLLPSYNLLLTARWMLLVPRRREHWGALSINALAFAGSLFVRRRSQLDELRAAGPIEVLRAV